MRMPALLATLCLAALAASSAQAAPPWSRLSYGKKLSGSQRKVAATALASVKGYHRCQETLERCLQKPKKTHRVAWRFADYLCFLASRGLDVPTIERIAARRRESTVGERRFRLDLAGWPLLGKLPAKIVIVEFADFRCTHCAKVSPLLETLAKRHGDKVAFIFKTYPLVPRGASLLSAQAALAAHRQGKFWPMHDLLFQHRDKHDRAGVLELARRAKLDLGRFEAALADRQILKQIERAKIEGLRNGIKGTPTIYVNGRQFLLRKDEMHLSQRIDDELDILAK